MDIKEVTLESLQYVATHCLPDSSKAGRLKAHVSIPCHMDVIMIMMVSYIWGIEHNAVDEKFPEDWWQAFKDRWFPEWAKQRWPVRWTRIHVTFREMYPEFQPALRSERCVVHMKSGSQDMGAQAIFEAEGDQGGKS